MHPPDSSIDHLKRELGALQAQLEQQQRLIAEQRTRIDELEKNRPAKEPSQSAWVTTRRALLIGTAATVGGGAIYPSAASADVQPTDDVLLLWGDKGGDGVAAAALPPASSSRGRLFETILDGKKRTFVSESAGRDVSNAGQIGVLGTSKNGFGLLGSASGSGLATGVKGIGTSRGVHGVATGSAADSIGVLAESRGTALAVNGVLRVSRAGRAKVAAGTRTVDVMMPRLLSSSLVMATPQENRGNVAVAGVVLQLRGATSFRISLTGPAPPGGLSVGWVVIDTMDGALDLPGR